MYDAVTPDEYTELMALYKLEGYEKHFKSTSKKDAKAFFAGKARPR